MMQADGVYDEKEIILGDLDGYVFYPHRDSYGHDISFNPNHCVEALKKMTDANPNAVAFNTYGYIKSDVPNLYQLSFLQPVLYRNDGIYVKKDFVAMNPPPPKPAVRPVTVRPPVVKPQQQEIPGYRLFPGLDSGGGDLDHQPGMSIQQLADACNLIDDVVAFNTQGWIKTEIKHPDHFDQMQGRLSLYVKESYLEKIGCGK